MISLSLSENTIKAILKRNNFKKEKKKIKRTGRHLYDYEALFPYQEFQVDTKHILDKSSLPLDVKTRTRFTAYSYELNSIETCQEFCVSYKYLNWKGYIP